MREALLNAIVHKDYSNGIPIQIKVYDDKIIFWNQGELPENWTVETLKHAHPSIPFNPDIASTFFRAGLIESWGRGIEKITHECLKHGLSAPEIQYDASFMLAMDASALLKKFKANDGINDGISDGINVGETSEKIITQIIANKHITVPELAKRLKVSSSTVERHLKGLKDEGKIRRAGSRKAGYWEIIG